MPAINNVVTTVRHTITDTSTRNFVVPFEYLSREHVYVYYNAMPIDNYEWVSTYGIRLTMEPELGGIIMIQRQTPFDEQMVVWHDGSVIFSDDMNLADLQMLFVLQEIKDPYNLSTKDLDDYIDGLRNTIPCPFGRFTIIDNGHLVLDMFGTMPPDNIYIDTDGHLIIETVDI